MTEKYVDAKIARQLILDNWQMSGTGREISLGYKWKKLIFIYSDNKQTVADAVNWFFDQIMEFEKND